MLSAPAVHATYVLAISYGPDQKKHNPEPLCKNIQIFIVVYVKYVKTLTSMRKKGHNFCTYEMYTLYCCTPVCTIMLVQANTRMRFKTYTYS